MKNKTVKNNTHNQRQKSWRANLSQRKTGFAGNKNAKIKFGASDKDRIKKQAPAGGFSFKRFWRKGEAKGTKIISRQITGIVTAVLMAVMLITAIISSVPRANAGESKNSLLPTPTIQLAKEYIYAGSRMLAIEDYGITPSPSPTPTPTP